MKLAGALMVMMLAAASPAAAQNVEKKTFGAGGASRTYYLFIPEKRPSPAPLVLLLHGSNRDGKSLMDSWQSLAAKEGFVAVAPDALKREGWSMIEDGPDFLYALIEMVRLEHDIDPQRMYLFGHSAGAIHGLAMGVLESEYFTAIAAHAGALPAEVVPYVARAPRKIPMAIWVGTNDALFPVSVVRQTRDALNAQGFDSRLTEIKGHTHWYYDRARDINKEVWAFFKDVKLAGDPKFQKYEMGK